MIAARRPPPAVLPCWRPDGRSRRDPQRRRRDRRRRRPQGLGRLPGAVADRLHVDFTALAGGEPGPLAADDLVGAWQANLHAATASLHLCTNHRIAVDGDTATCVSKGYALNAMTRPAGDDLWEVWGWYEHTLQRSGDGWLCTGMTLDVVHARGNEAVRTAGPDG